jgi:hypothetical protein
MSKHPKRAELVLFPRDGTGQSHRADIEDDYAVYASYRPSLGRYIGTLTVVRLADARLLYPFDGADKIGPFDSMDAAREAAVELGEEIVRADLLSPEL